MKSGSAVLCRRCSALDPARWRGIRWEGKPKPQPNPSMLRWLSCRTYLLLGLLCLWPVQSSAQQRLSPVPPLPDSAYALNNPFSSPAAGSALATPKVSSGSCLSPKYSLVLPVGAVTLFALPVAGLAAVMAHRRRNAATGALVGGALYAGGATVAVASNCDPQAIFTYFGTPFAAAAGAVVGGVWGR